MRASAEPYTWSGRSSIATRLSSFAIRSYSSQSALRRFVVALKMYRRARRSFSGSVLPEWVSSALPSNTRNPDHQSACEIRTEQRGSRSRFLNFIRFSVIEVPTTPSRGYTVTMLSWGIPFRRNEVSTPCGLSWMNCSICGARGGCVGIDASSRVGSRSGFFGAALWMIGPRRSTPRPPRGRRSGGIAGSARAEWPRRPNSGKEAQMAMALPEDVKKLIDGPNFAHLATIMPDGSPQSAPVWVLREGERILVGTGEASLKARNTRRDPRVALSIVDVKDPYTEAQLRGRVVEFRPDR